MAYLHDARQVAHRRATGVHLRLQVFQFHAHFLQPCAKPQERACTCVPSPKHSKQLPGTEMGDGTTRRRFSCCGGPQMMAKTSSVLGLWV